MTNDELEAEVKEVLKLFESASEYYILKVARQIAEIGEMSASRINIMAVIASMNESIAAINARIARAAQMSIPKLYGIYNAALNDVYRDPRFERALQAQPLPDGSRRALNRLTQAVSRQTAGTMINLSNTTAVSETYRKAVDKGVMAVTSGVGDYHTEMRQTIRELGDNGVLIETESGALRRLDTAVRQNIIDGAKQIEQHASDIISDELGYDAREISVHANSAPDHEPVQGHVFMLDEFYKLQHEQACVDIDGKHFPAMKRPIAEWNCMHFAFGFSTEYSKRKYTNEQLDEFAQANAQGCTIDGKHYTMYEARQLMRKIETKIRKEKDIAVAAKEAGDMELRRQCQRKINALANQYKRVEQQSGLPGRRDRMRVEGFRMVKVS